MWLTQNLKSVLLDRYLKNHPESKKYRNIEKWVTEDQYWALISNSEKFQKKMEQRKVKGQNYQRNNRRQFCQDSRITWVFICCIPERNIRSYIKYTSIIKKRITWIFTSKEDHWRVCRMEKTPRHINKDNRSDRKLSEGKM